MKSAYRSGIGRFRPAASRAAWYASPPPTRDRVAQLYGHPDLDEEEDRGEEEEEGDERPDEPAAEEADEPRQAWSPFDRCVGLHAHLDPDVAAGQGPMSAAPKAGRGVVGIPFL